MYKHIEVCVWLQNAFAKGEVFIGPKERGYDVSEAVDFVPKDVSFPFKMKTPERIFYFSADTAVLRQEWIDALNSVICTPLTPQESSGM